MQKHSIAVKVSKLISNEKENKEVKLKNLNHLESLYIDKLR